MHGYPRIVNVGLTDEGVHALAQALPPTLREIYIRARAPFSTEATDRLQRALPPGATIR